MFASSTIKNMIREGDHYNVSLSAKWSGSWKNNINCDGIYIFLKYKNKGEYGYHSAAFESESGKDFDYSDLTPDCIKIDGASSPVGAYVPDEKLGVFIYPLKETEKTDISIPDITVNLKMDGDIEDIQVFTLEME